MGGNYGAHVGWCTMMRGRRKSEEGKGGGRGGGGDRNYDVATSATVGGSRKQLAV